jgi:hypothetical protein
MVASIAPPSPQKSREAVTTAIGGWLMMFDLVSVSPNLHGSCIALVRLATFLKRFVVITAALSLCWTVWWAFQEECTSWSGKYSTCVDSSHTHVGQAFGIGVAILVQSVLLIAVFQLLVVIGLYCSREDRYLDDEDHDYDEDSDYVND